VVLTHGPCGKCQVNHCWLRYPVTIGGRSCASPARGLEAAASAFQPMGVWEMARRSLGDSLMRNWAIATRGARDGDWRVGHQPVVSAKRTWVISDHWEINHWVPHRNRCLRECLTSQAHPIPRCWCRLDAVAISGSARRGL
jgi:hypothetical protein